MQEACRVGRIAPRRLAIDIMEIHFINSIEEWDALVDPWNDLLERSITVSPFLRHEFLRVWWSTRGGGEWEEGDLWIAIASESGGQLVGAAPLFASHNRNGDLNLYLIGSIEIADTLDVLVEPDLAAGFFASLLEALEVAGPPNWKSIDLQNIPEASPTLSGLTAAAYERGWSHIQQRLAVSPYVSLHGSWETYLEGLESKQRRELKRKIRRAESYPSSVTWRISDTAELDRDIGAFLALMETDPAKAEFLTDAMREQFRKMVLTLGESALIQLAMLFVGDELACGYLNLDYHGKLWVYNSSVNPDYFRLSPGWVLMGYIIQWAIEEGRSEVDFLRGSEDYKYRLGGVDREVFRLLITRES